jgi:4'-phosphopantetheinyl transferase EntD
VDEGQLWHEERRIAQEMGERRRLEFLVGRLAARRALEALGVPPGPVGAEDRRPRFPAPAVGSISHSHGLGVAVAGLGAAIGGVGVDVELGRISLRAARGICTADELAWALEAGSDAARARRATALFSAKESVFKALPAAAQAAAGWRDVVITPRAGGYTGRVTPAGASGGACLELAGGWRRGRAVLTWAIRQAG